jgi:N utilization substance protein B
MSSRHRAREYVLKALYALELGEQSLEEIQKTVIEQAGISKPGFEFARNLFIKVATNIPQIDGYITKLATNWDIDRLAVVDKNILRMAICEVENMPDIPVKVAINEAIELAKKYSTLESTSFVNGILDKVMKDKGAEEEDEEAKNTKIE